ncbi:MAG: hypothetical protein H7329_05775 [Opitutaceae bacterium]|nr:hypothetical protein [Cytophagales bacterium]
MKHTFVAIALFLTCLSSQAQFKRMKSDQSDSVTNQIIASDTLTPRKGEKTLTFALADNSGFFMFKKYCSPKVAFRYGFSGNYNITDQSLPQASGPSTEVKNRFFAYQLFFGFQRSFGNFKRFEPYMGMDLGLGNRMEKSIMTSYSPIAGFGGSPNTVIETKIERKSNFSPSVSLTPLIGFNYYIAERFALGAEYRIPVANFYMTTNSTSKTTQKYANGTSDTKELNDAETMNFSGNFRGIAYVTATLFLYGHCK